MSNNESLGPVQVFDNSPTSINDALRQVGDRIDEIKGLRGRAEIFDRTRVSDPVEASDAVSLGSAAVVSSDGEQTITGTKTFVLPVRIVDSSGHLIHSFGTKL